MELKAVRRACAVREAGGFLALPLVYGVLMGLGVLSYAPSLAFLTMGLVFMLVLQQRSGLTAASLAPRRGRAKGQGFPAAELDGADRRMLRQVLFAAGSDMASYLVLILSIDVHLRAQAAGADPGFVLYLGALVAIAVAVAGRRGARKAAWAGFDTAAPRLWASTDGLHLGRTARSTASYLAWRENAQALE